MPNATVKTHPVKGRELTARVGENRDARREALDWIVDQLRWERTLDAVRARNGRR